MAKNLGDKEDMSDSQDKLENGRASANITENINSQSGWLRKIFLALIILLLGGTGSGLVYGWYVLQRKLVPLIETEASKYLHRPLELGKLQTVSLTRATFAQSALPPTEINPDRVITEKVQVNFNPWYFLRKRILQIDIILIKPDVYIEQDEAQVWTPTNFGSDEPSSDGIKVDVETIQLRGGVLTLAARQAETGKLNPPVTAKIKRTIITIVNDGEAINFDVAAALVEGGKFTVNGETFTETDIIDLTVEANRLDAAEVSNLLALPIELNAGEIDGTIAVKLTDAPLPELNGTLSVDNLSLQIPGLVKAFSDSQGKFHFQGSEVELRAISTNFGEVTGVVNGSLDLAETGNYQIDTQVEPVDINQIVEALELEPPPVPIEGKVQGKVLVRGSLLEPVIGFDLTTTTPSRVDQLDFRNITAYLDLIGSDLYIRNFQANPNSGGEFRGNGRLELDGNQNLLVDVIARGIAASAIARSYDNELPVNIGRIDGQARLLAQIGKPETFQINNGLANFPLGKGMVDLRDLNYADEQWRSQLRLNRVEFGSLPIGQGSAPTIAQGRVDGNFAVTGTSDVGNLSQVKATGEATLDTVGGKIIIPDILLADGGWQADANTTNLRLRQLFPEVPVEFNDNLSGEFELTGNIPDEQQPSTIINGQGNLILAGGRVKVSDLKIVDDNWSAIADGTNLELKQLSSATPDQFAGLVNGRLKLSGTIDNITPDGVKARGNGSLTLPEGVFESEELAIADGRFQAKVIPQQVDLSLFADPNSDELELNGQLGGELIATGRVDNLTPTAVAATGNLTFSQGIDLLQQPFGAAIRWDGRRLDVLKARGEGLEATGYLELDPSFFSDIPDKLAAVDYFEFDVTEAKWIDITKLRVPLPNWAINLDYSGRADFFGNISGIPAAMNIDGDLNVRDFQVEDIVFKPLLWGNVAIAPETGVNLQLSESESDGQQLTDRIELQLDSNFLPVALAIARDQMIITGTGRQEILDLTADNVPVEFLKTVAIKSEDVQIPENFAVQTLSGRLSGDFVFNLNTLSTSGENLVVESPRIGSIQGDRLEGDFQYADGYFAIQNAKFIQLNSIYKLEGGIIQKPDDISLDGRISVNNGQIQDVLIALQIFELMDFSRIFSDRNYGNADTLYDASQPKQPPLLSVGLKNATLLEQIELLSEIQAWLAAVTQKRQQALIPELKVLQGTFDGEVRVFGSLNEGINSQFEFSGNQWQWGNLGAEQIVANGSFTDGILTLVPISIKLTDTFSPPDKQDLSPTIFFSGTFGGETPSGNLRLVQIPVQLVEQLLSLPPEIALGGEINASATIAGTRENPQARGEITIADASLNQTSVESTKGSFNYKNARLDFSASSVIVADAEPLILTGNIPYQLPFIATIPDSDRAELKVNVKNKGLALLDIFSRGEISWKGGEGEIALDITGRFDSQTNALRDLVAEGIAVVNNATIAARTLPNALLTEVTGDVSFDLDQIQVNSIQGNFGGGQISAAGIVPLDDKNISVTNPLSINFDDILVNLKGLYNGGVKGTLKILGTALEPDLTGDITLFDGKILLADSTATPTDPSSNLRNTDNGLAAATEYKNLKLTLGNNIEISQPPIFTFMATGSLKINGTFELPVPEGTIVLQRGQVNLFTTQLNLSRDYENTARFTRSNELDPTLDLLLIGSALETTDRGILTDPASSEVSDIAPSGFGTLETVRVEAKVRGPASQITNGIELTSSPPRSQTEIIALLGGSFVSTLGGATSTLGLANLAGSALFGSFHSEFNNLFPIGQLRLFPTQILVDENRDRGRIEGLAGEIAVDIFNNFSFSVLKILNVDSIPAQFGFRYRLDKNFVLRGSTNFTDETRGLIEFESRF
ncbi:MAG: translocation/assembly module TamB domain-containing protein [Pleurocapsa sp.]